MSDAEASTAAAPDRGVVVLLDEEVVVSGKGARVLRKADAPEDLGHLDEEEQMAAEVR